MALREDQIQRYSRQILLREVGGRGQVALLAAAFEVAGQSLALDVAVACLAASGTPVRDSAKGRAGYVHGTTLEQLSPDAVAQAPSVGWLGPLSAAASTPTSLVRVGLGPAIVVGVAAGVPWPTLGRSTAHPEQGSGADAEPVTHGSMAALIGQRLVLGLGPPVVTVRFDGGRWSVQKVEPG
jgi:molybdopterin-synthase adenylyltransferase